MITIEDRDGHEEAVLIHIPLQVRPFGDSEERMQIENFQDQLRSSLDDSELGQLDGDEFNSDTCTVYLYGASADSLAGVVLALASRITLSPGAHLIKRYGGPGAEECKISLCQTSRP